MIHKLRALDIARLRSHSSRTLGVIAALSYSSWPLAFLLNPWVGRHELASELEAPHQPYAWVFIMTDVLTGVFIMLVGLLQLRTRKVSRLLFAAVAGYVLFGAMVAGAALSPLTCDPAQQSCAPLLRHPALVMHGGFSILSVVCLLFSVVAIAIAAYQRPRQRILQALLAGTLLCWAVFGAGALLEQLLHIRDNNTLQYFFISVCSISLALVIGAIESLTRKAQTVSLSEELLYNRQNIR
ncbi:MAG TPA: DUF998 domain-containing protein [Candidatus Saccharimonadales bacterium]|nr:DUF998 domain-containing protein [Candidatus Saccharimonadales bacterium]